MLTSMAVFPFLSPIGNQLFCVMKRVILPILVAKKHEDLFLKINLFKVVILTKFRATVSKAGLWHCTLTLVAPVNWPLGWRYQIICYCDLPNSMSNHYRTNVFLTSIFD